MADEAPETVVIPDFAPTRAAGLAWSEVDPPARSAKATRPKPKPKSRVQYESWAAAWCNVLVFFMAAAVLVFTIWIVGWTLSQDQNGQPTGVVPGYTPGPFQD